jgi:hypothetical protein
MDVGDAVAARGRVSERRDGGRCRRPSAPPALRRGFGLLSCVAALCGSGCAITHTASDGSRHLIGWMWVTLPPVDFQPAAETLRTRSLGLSVTRSEAGSALVLGYQDATMGFVRNHSLVPALALRPGATAPQAGQP